MKRRLLSLAVSLLLLGGVAAAYANRQWIRDSYVVRTVQQQPAALTLEDDLELTNTGRFLYRASRPAVEPAATFNSLCRGVNREQTIVLGCYSQQQIYIYKITDQRLGGVQQVTAAHELLHAVYERLSNNERQAVNQLLNDQATRVTNPRLQQLLAQYQQSEPNSVINEMYSIFGTEVAELSPQLEAHYSKYFSNRQKIVDYSRTYEQTFTNLEKQIQDYTNQLENLKSKKESLETSLESQQRDIELSRQRLESLRQEGQIAAYNDGVAPFNAKIRSYNLALEQLQAVITNYNDVVSKRNAVATTQNDLSKQLDSKFQPLQ